MRADGFAAVRILVAVKFTPNLHSNRSFTHGTVTPALTSATDSAVQLVLRDRLTRVASVGSRRRQ